MPYPPLTRLLQRRTGLQQAPPHSHSATAGGTHSRNGDSVGGHDQSSGQTRPYTHPFNIVVSMATAPDRIGHIEPTLRSLAEQTLPRSRYEIVLTCPVFSMSQNTTYDIPEFIHQLGVTLMRPEVDHFSASKLYPVLQRERAAGRHNTLLIMCDDDWLYAPTLIQDFLEGIDRLGESAAATLRGMQTPFDLQYSQFMAVWTAGQINEDRRIAVLTNPRAVRPWMFPEEPWDYRGFGAPTGCVHMDDVWFSGLLARNPQVKRYLLARRQGPHTAGTTAKYSGRQELMQELSTDHGFAVGRSGRHGARVHLQSLMPLPYELDGSWRDGFKLNRAVGHSAITTDNIVRSEENTQCYRYFTANWDDVDLSDDADWLHCEGAFCRRTHKRVRRFHRELSAPLARILLAASVLVNVMALLAMRRLAPSWCSPLQLCTEFCKPRQKFLDEETRLRYEN